MVDNVKIEGLLKKRKIVEDELNKKEEDFLRLESAGTNTDALKKEIENIKERLKTIDKELEDEDHDTYQRNQKIKGVAGKTASIAGNIFKKVGKGALVAGGAVAGASLAGLRNAGKAIGGPGERSSGNSSSSSGSSNGVFIFLFFCSIILSIVDPATGYIRLGFNYILMSYLIILIVGLIFIYRGNASGASGFIIAILLSYFLPMAANIFSDIRWLTILSTILFAFPFLVLYFMFNFPEESRWHKLAIGYIVFWIILAIILLMTSFAGTAGVGKQTINTPQKYAILGFKALIQSVSTMGTQITNSINTALRPIMCPDCGGTEETEKGIYLEDLKATDSTYYTGSDVWVQANIRAKNVNGSIIVRTICFVPGEKQGNVTPATIKLSYDDENVIDCNLGKLNAGSKEVKFASTFEFETDSEITYTFMDTNVLSAMNLQNDELYKNLNIPEIAQAIYTGGPVEVGLPQLHQPFRIDPKNPNAVTYPFGVSLTNKWTQGKIVKGLTYVLEVPDSITLIGCNRKISKYEINNSKNKYTFLIDDAQAQETFDSVTCRMNIVDVNKLLGTDMKSVKTFSARVRYLYSVEASTFVNIEKI